MDIMLERILSLVPKKPDGKFVHGALKEFAQTVGLKSGNLISDWINGRSTSYTGYVYEIATKYNVSVEWLKGETDQKENPATESSEVSKETIALSLEKMSTSDLVSLMSDITDALKKREAK